MSRTQSALLHMVVDAVAQPANQAEHDALETLGPALEAHGPVRSLSMDRAYLSRPLLSALTAHGLDMLATPWPWRNRGRFPTEPLPITRDRHEVTCPAGGTVRLTGAGRAHRPAAPCGQWALPAACTTSARGHTRRRPHIVSRCDTMRYNTIQ